MNAISQIIDFFIVLGNLIINILKSLLMLLLEIPRWLGFTTVLFGFLPPALLSFAIFATALGVLFLVIGRNG